MLEDMDREDESVIEGRNAVREAFRSGRTVERLYVLEGLRDGSVLDLVQRARKSGAVVDRVSRQLLDRMSSTGRHQGVIAHTAAYGYSSVDDILEDVMRKKEDAFIFLLDGIEDPHNLGAIIRTANICGAHGVIIPKRHSASLTAAAVKASAGAVNYTKVAKSDNLSHTIDDLKHKGLWFVCADTEGKLMYDLSLTGPIGIVIGSEGKGVRELVREKCDFCASIPMKGNISSLNASVAAGVLAYEIVRQRMRQKHL